MSVGISIIIPVYNVESYLEKCLDSLLAQTFQDFEIIAVDDSSTDGSLAILKKYAKKDSRIRVFSQKNAKQGAARNNGLSKADGEYIYFIDSDDWISSDFLEGMYLKAQKEKADIVINDNICFYQNEKNQSVLKGLSGEMIVDHKNIKNVHPSVCNKLWRKGFLDECGILFPERIRNEDLYFTYAVFMNARKIFYVDQGQYFYLVRTSGTMGRLKVEENYDILKIFKMLDDYIKGANLFEIFSLPVKHLMDALVRQNNKEKLHAEIKAWLSGIEINYSLYSKKEKKLIKYLQKNWGTFYWGYYVSYALKILRKKLFRLKLSGTEKSIVLFGWKLR